MNLLRSVVAAALLTLAVCGPGLVLPPAAPSKPAAPSPSVITSAVYVYEKDQTAIPPGVSAGMNRLNREKKILAVLFEADTVDGRGQVPARYKPALDAAKRDGLPSLVVMAGDSVKKVVKSPLTEAAVMEAVQ
jgi:hypothetical protein